MKTRHYTIPVFVPELACPNRCVFCNQYSISGISHQPSAEMVTEQIENYLSTIPLGQPVEIGFFGGNFTGIGKQQQELYLGIATHFVDQGRAKSIRLSTRPDYINSDCLEFLKHYPVRCIELGAQSLCDDVLQLSGRGHSAFQVREASARIKENGFELGLQMMIGLPGDTEEKSLYTANTIAELGADCTRIYPTLVIRHTTLEKLWRQGSYQPLSLEEAVSLAAKVARVFHRSDIKILRMGLHPSEGLLNGSELVAGPFHPAFGELVYTAIWKEILTEALSERNSGSFPSGYNRDKTLVIEVAPSQLNAVAGHKGSNRRWLSGFFPQIRFIPNPQFTGFEYNFSH